MASAVTHLTSRPSLALTWVSASPGVFCDRQSSSFIASLHHHFIYFICAGARRTRRRDERRGIRRSHCLATVKQNGTHTSRGIRPLLGIRLPRRCFYSDCRRRHTHPRIIAHFHGNRGGRWQRHRWYWLVAAAAPSFRGYGVWSQGGLFVDSNSSAPIVGIIFGQKAAIKVDKYSRASTNASTCPRTIHVRGSDETSATSI